MTDPLDLPPLDLPPDRAERLRRMARSELRRAHDGSWADRVQPTLCVAFAAAFPVWAAVVALGVGAG